MAGRIAVVDDENRFVRWEDRKTIHVERLVHRSIHVLVFDTQDRLVVQRRSPDKQTYPDVWDSSCAGHVEESDYPAGPDDDLDTVYAAVAARELAEELGLHTPLEELGQFGPMAGIHYEQLRLYRTVADGPYTLQPEEVAEVRALTPAEWDVFNASNAKITEVLSYFVDWLRERARWTQRSKGRWTQRSKAQWT